MKNFAGVDQSLTQTGVTIFNNENELINFIVIKSDKTKLEEERIEFVGDELLTFLKDNDVKHVAIEGLSFGSISTSVRVLSGLYYYILIHLKNEGITYSVHPPKSIKKLATGSGNAKKSLMFDVFKEDYNNEFNEFMKRYKKTTGVTDLIDSFYMHQHYLISNTD